MLKHIKRFLVGLAIFAVIGFGGYWLLTAMGVLANWIGASYPESMPLFIRGLLGLCAVIGVLSVGVLCYSLGDAVYKKKSD